MTNWNTLIDQALKELGGETEFVKGARLRTHVATLGNAEGSDLGKHLIDTGVKFSDLVAEVANVVLIRLAGTDMLVGFEGAARPPPATGVAKWQERVEFRGDVYDALTRISDRPHYYVVSRGEFTQDPASEKSVEMPPTNLQSLLDERRRFSESQPTDELRNELLAAIDYSANPLAQFHRVISDRRLSASWHEFNVEYLKAKLENWADENGLAKSPDWYSQTPHARPETPQEMLARLAQFMTDDEVRAMPIPFRALEELLQTLTHRRAR